MTTLLADIGGTHARFARLDAGGIGAPLILPVAGSPTVEDAIAEALARLGPAEKALLALAGPVTADPVRLTNAPWEIGSAALAARFGFAAVRLVNDFVALAHALPYLGSQDTSLLNAEARADLGAPRLVLGPGTGLGAALLVPTQAGPVAVPTEAGHMDFGWALAIPFDQRQPLNRGGRRVSAEHVLSGSGLVRLHEMTAPQAAARLTGPREARAAAILQLAEQDDEAALNAVRHFLDAMASFAGDLALATGARGGVFMAGGILPRLLPWLDPVGFAFDFRSKPPMEGWLGTIPLHVVTHPAPAFLGLAAIAEPFPATPGSGR